MHPVIVSPQDPSMESKDRPSVLGLITARGGSKGLPGKNVRSFNGLPLIAWTIKAALQSTAIDTVLVSTDDEEIRNQALAFGAQAPFLRPAALATDQSPVADTIVHALEWLSARGEPAEVLCLLQPTQPLRTGRMLDEIINHFLDHGKTPQDTLVTVDRAPSNCDLLLRQSGVGLLEFAFDRERPRRNRQEAPTLFLPNGLVYLAHSHGFLKNHEFYGPRTLFFETDPAFSADIDTEADFFAAELKQRELREKELI